MIWGYPLFLETPTSCFSSLSFVYIARHESSLEVASISDRAIQNRLGLVSQRFKVEDFEDGEAKQHLTDSCFCRSKLHLEVDLFQDPRILRLNERQFKQLFQQFKDITAVWSVKSRYGLSHVVSSIALTSTHHGLTSCVPWSKLPMLGMVISPLIGIVMMGI